VPRFQAELKQRSPGNFVEIPFDPPEVFGEARPPVRGTLNGLPFRGRIAKYDGEYMLGVEWIAEAKRPETRTRRVAKAVELIREGKPQR